MAISYSATAWNTAGTASGALAYKDITITGCQVGDLLVVFAVGEGTGGPTSGATVATQSGTTSAWTILRPAVSSGADVSVVGGYATVSTAGNVTVRGTLNVLATSNRMGVGAYRIPAADKGATFGWVGSGFAGDADGQASVTLSGNSVVFYGAGDWSASNPGSTTTPTGATVGTTYFDTSNYATFIAHWTGQASGTRNYGPSGLSGRDFSGAIFRMDSPIAGVTGTISSTVPAFTQAASGTSSAPVFTGTISSTIPTFTQAAEGNVVNPGGDYSPSDWGTANLTLTDPTSAVTGEISSTVPAFTQVASGSVVNPTEYAPSEWGTANLTLTDPVAPNDAPAYRWDGVQYVALDAYRWSGSSYVVLDSA